MHACDFKQLIILMGIRTPSFKQLLQRWTTETTFFIWPLGHPFSVTPSEFLLGIPLCRGCSRLRLLPPPAYNLVRPTAFFIWHCTCFCRFSWCLFAKKRKNAFWHGVLHYRWPAVEGKLRLGIKKEWILFVLRSTCITVDLRSKVSCVSG